MENKKPNRGLQLFWAREPLLLCFFIGLLGLSSCFQDERFQDINPNFQVRFSSDTVLFDTVFSEVASITRRIKLYNQSNSDLRIAELRFGGGEQSPYRMRSFGREGKIIRNIEIARGDSLLFILDLSPANQDQVQPYVIEDSLLIFSESGELMRPQAKLLAWGQDAHFFSQAQVWNDTVLTKSKPLVFLKGLLIPEGQKLRIEEGVRLFFAPRAELLIGGQLEVEGSPKQPVIFRNNRLDENFLNAPGQWEGVFFGENSGPHLIRYARIENASTGLWVGIPNNEQEWDLRLEQVVIKNMASSGILAFSSRIYAQNLLINNCNQYLMACLAGGTYELHHCTLSNAPNDFLRNDASLVVSNQLDIGGSEPLQESLEFSMKNSILWGNESEEFRSFGTEEVQLIINLENNILRSAGAVPQAEDNQLSQSQNYPGFVEPQRRDFRLKENSPARNNGLESQVNIDLSGAFRTFPPDLGAWEYTEIPEEE